MSSEIERRSHKATKVQKPARYIETKLTTRKVRIPGTKCKMKNRN